MRSVKDVSGAATAASARAAKASITLPTAVACGTLGRPTNAMLTTLEGEGTKSTVIASSAPGSDSVAVSPVSATSRTSSGRARWRTSSWASTRSESATSFSPSRYGPAAGALDQPGLLQRARAGATPCWR